MTSTVSYGAAQQLASAHFDARAIIRLVNEGGKLVYRPTARRYQLDKMAVRVAKIDAQPTALDFTLDGNGSIVQPISPRLDIPG